VCGGRISGANENLLVTRKESVVNMDPAEGLLRDGGSKNPEIMEEDLRNPGVGK